MSLLDTSFQSPWPRTRRGRVICLVFWVLAGVAIPFWAHYDPPAWDVHIYQAAIHSLRAGHDPYADAIEIQREFHVGAAFHPGAQLPYSYVYSPITLPLLRVLSQFPGAPVVWLYWLFYAVGLFAQIWAGLQAQDEKEREYLCYFAPIAAFFPALLASDILLSGNIAFPLYGAILLAAVHGWRRGSWGWFYLAVVLASCFKAPLLSLLAIPVLSAQRQWLRAGVAAVAGLALFAIQPLLWPTLFQHYLQAVELQFSYNGDFGCSPAGVFGKTLWNRHIPYSPATTIFYLAYALPLFGMLLYLSRKFLRGDFSLKQWVPVMLVGVLLLNPRLIEYDLAPLAIPMALVVFRFAVSLTGLRRGLFVLLTAFVIVNCIGQQSWETWKIIAGWLIPAVFAVGCYTLLRDTRDVQPA